MYCYLLKYYVEVSYSCRVKLYHANFPEYNFFIEISKGFYSQKIFYIHIVGNIIRFQV